MSFFRSKEKIMRSGILLYAAFLTVCTYGQTRDTGAIFGSVTDSQGAAIHGAVVILTSTATGQARKVEANVSGQFTYASLPVGVYTLTAEQVGFSKQEKTGIRLQANENVRVDMTLQVGDVKTTVAVEADAAQVDLRSATIKDTVDQQRVVELPLNGRNAADLALLAPGVTGYGNNNGDVTGSTYRPRGTKQFSINGSRNNNVRFTLDGGENMDNLWNVNLPFPFPDAVQEFSVETSNKGLDSGNSSAGAVNVVTKSGSNQIHGNGFWFVRNTSLNASNFFSQTQDQLKRNQAGFTLGGPIRKDKLFAFGGFQNLWIRTASGATRAQTLTAAERAGNFSSNPITIYDPTSGSPFPNNTIPQSRFSPAAVKLLSVSPLPGPDGFTNFVQSLPENGRQYIGRLDYLASAKHTFMFRVFYNDQVNPYHSPADNIHATKDQGDQESRTATLSHNYVASANLFAHTQFTAMLLRATAASDWPHTVNDFGLKTFAASNDVEVNLSGSGVSFQSAQAQVFNRSTEEMLHDWTWIKGSHTVTFGAQFNWRQYNEITVFNSSGYWTFDGSRTGSGNKSGFDRADFLLGSFASFTQNNGELENRRQFTKGFFINDVWRMSRKLTLTAGLRYEPYDYFTDTLNRNQTFDAGNFVKGIKSTVFLNAPPGLLFVGDKDPSGGTIGGSVSKSDWHNFAPRVGFAYDPFGSGNTAIRGGVGVYFDSPLLFGSNNANDVSPWSYSVLFTSGLLDDPYLGRESLNKYPLSSFGPQSPFATPLETIVLDGRYLSPYTMNWNIAVEQQLVRDARIRVAYVGTKTTHLKGEYDQNAPIYNMNLTLSQNIATIDQRRPFQGYSRIERFFHGLGSDYNALQVSFDKRYSNGFTILTSYTWSKGMDYQSSNQAAQDAPASYPYNFSLSRGPTNADRTHVFTNSFVWDLPGNRVSQPFVKAIARDWKLSGILTLMTGRFFGINSTGNVLAGVAGGRVSLVGAGSPILDTGRPKGQKVKEYFDVTRFQNPGADSVGTLGRNALEGPGFENLDLSIVRTFPLHMLGERFNTQFRFEAFNTLNRTNLGLPNTSITSSNFGKITSTDGDPRILQLSLKFNF
jgi:hypothetical protein